MEPAAQKIVGLIVSLVGLGLLVVSVKQVLIFLNQDRINPFLSRSAYVTTLTLYVYAAIFSVVLLGIGVYVATRDRRASASSQGIRAFGKNGLCIAKLAVSRLLQVAFCSTAWRKSSALLLWEACLTDFREKHRELITAIKTGPEASHG